MVQPVVETEGALLRRQRTKRRYAYIGGMTFFALMGIVLCSGLFYVLREISERLMIEERLKLSEQAFSGVSETFLEVQEALGWISGYLEFSQAGQEHAILQKLQKDEDKAPVFEAFSQVLWFYKRPDQRWVYSSVFEEVGETLFQPDSRTLNALLQKNVMGFSGAIMLDDVIKFSPEKQKNDIVHITSHSFVMVKAVEAGNSSKGFVVAFVKPHKIFAKESLEKYKGISFLRVADLANNKTYFSFDRALHLSEPRNPESVETDHKYEFIFANKTFQISDVVNPSFGQFLLLFPYVSVGAAVVFFVAGFLHLFLQYRSGLLIFQKNKELEIEVFEKERLQKNLREAQSENRSIIDSVRDVIFEITAESKLLYLNKAWNHLTGFEVEHVRHKDFFAFLHPQQQKNLKEQFEKFKKEGAKNFSVQSQIMLHDGTYKSIECDISVVRKEDKKGVRYIGTIIDIEDRKRVERALGEVEKKYKNIVENAAGGIYQMTMEGGYLSANPAMARILGYESSEGLLREIKNSNEQIYINPSTRESFYHILETQGHAYNQEFQARKRDGKIIWLNENARVVKDDAGQILYLEGSIEDITERKESETYMRKAKMESDMVNRAKSEFLSNMSHELRTPLNSIIGFSEMIKNEVLGPLQQKSYLEYARDIHDSGKRLLKIINEILDISKIEAGERQLNEGLVKIPVVVATVLDMLDMKIRTNKLSVVVSLENLPDIVCEELAFKQIVLNLLSNAVKFTPPNGRITISAHIARNGKFHFSITDTGVGLTDEEIQKALSPFGQLDNDLHRSGSGAGLGLTLVDALVKIHGGDFELFSQKGIGTTVTIVLPAERVYKAR